jgi:hypothetical protein
MEEEFKVCGILWYMVPIWPSSFVSRLVVGIIYCTWEKGAKQQKRRDRARHKIAFSGLAVTGRHGQRSSQLKLLDLRLAGMVGE